jgi:tRNA (adenine57-N1/adenine58-N1)-methyltransferase
LTLQLARAIHGANTAAPRILSPSSDATSEDEEGGAYRAWRTNRRALISSIDISPVHSEHAQKVVRNFRRGMYYPHVDFHVGKISDFLSSRLASNKEEPFLAHAILDLPDPSLYLGMLGKALHPFGKLITFNPSITQTLNSLQVVKDQRLPFMLEKVLEIGTGVGTEGREWDLRSVLPKSRQRNVMPADNISTRATKDAVPDD